MAAYAALLSLAQTTDLINGTLQSILFSNYSDCEENFRAVHDSSVILLSFLDDFPEKARRWEGKIRDLAQDIEDAIETFLWQKFQSPHRYIGLSGLANQLRIAKTEIGDIVADIMEDRPASASSPSRSAPAAVDGMLSYMNLPHHLRPCFLFIGGFKDAEIHASRLIRLWVAEGFIKHQTGISLEEEAEEYLEELVRRNLVTVTKKNSTGKIKRCKLNDMTRELCIRKALEEKFLHVMAGHDLPLDMINARHMISSRFVGNVDGRPTTRTILHLEPKHRWNIPSQPVAWGRFRLLRVLDAIYENHREIPSEVLLHLFYLRFLAIAVPLRIPSSISNLLHLQTLIIGPKFPEWEKEWDLAKIVSHYTLPLQIWEMPQLRHIIFINKPYTLPHPPLQSNLPLLNLQTLSLVRDLVLNEKILQMIPNVKKLGLVYTSKQCFNIHLLKHLQQLEKLKIRVAGHDEIWWKEQNSSFPTTLRKLSLVGGRFPFEDMAIVGSLPNLEVLKLHDHATDGETWEIGDEYFPNLKVLSIDKSSLQHWKTQGSPFPRLIRLVLSHMRNLRKIPEGIAEISTLELIDLRLAEESLVESAMQVKEVQHSYGNYDLQVLVPTSARSYIYEHNLKLYMNATSKQGGIY